MGKIYDSIDARLERWIGRQPMFFVATAPDEGGHVNLSPKGPIESLRVLDPHTVAIEGRRYTTQTLLIATGSWPWKPAIPGVESTITSNEAFHLERLPRRVLIGGGGYIAVEFAGIFNGLGVETTLLYRGPNILRGFDSDVRAHLAGELESRGITVMLGCTHASLEKTAGGILSRLNNGHQVETDVVQVRQIQEFRNVPNKARVGSCSDNNPRQTAGWNSKK